MQTNFIKFFILHINDPYTFFVDIAELSFVVLTTFSPKQVPC